METVQRYVPVLLAWILLSACSIFEPPRLADGALFMAEQEMAGCFTGRRLVFNARDVLVGAATVNRCCTVEPSGDRLRCLEKTHYDAGQTRGLAGRAAEEERSFSVAFRYLSEASVDLRYREDGALPFHVGFFQGGDAAGAGIRLFGGSVIPLSDVPVGMELRLVRDEFVPPGTIPAAPGRYYEKRVYSYFGFQYGSSETRWQRDH